MNPEFQRTMQTVLRLSCEKAQELEGHSISSDAVLPLVQAAGISEDDMYDALEVLAEHGRIKAYSLAYSGKVAHFSIPHEVFHDYAESNMADYISVFEAVKEKVKEGETTSEAIAAAIEQPHWLVAHVLETLKVYRLIDGTTFFGGTFVVSKVTPRLKHE